MQIFLKCILMMLAYNGTVINCLNNCLTSIDFSKPHAVWHITLWSGKKVRIIIDKIFNYTTRDAILYFKTKSEWKNVLVTLFFKCCICSPYCQTVPDTFRSGWYMKMININYIDKLQTNFTIISIPINYTHLPSIKYQKICMRQNLYFKKKKIPW